MLGKFSDLRHQCHKFLKFNILSPGLRDLTLENTVHEQHKYMEKDIQDNIIHSLLTKTRIIC